MAAMRWLVVALMAAAISGCGYSIPKPEYSLVKIPAPYRTGQDGVRIDNAGVALDQTGYRVDKSGQQMGIIDVQAKTEGQSSNPMAGFYISSLGANATGNIMTPIEGAKSGPGYGPGSANPGAPPDAGLPSPQPKPSP